MKRSVTTKNFEKPSRTTEKLMNGGLEQSENAQPIQKTKNAISNTPQNASTNGRKKLANVSKVGMVTFVKRT